MDPIPTDTTNLNSAATGSTLDIRDWIREHPGRSTAELVDVLQRDQLHRWRRGERVPAETYLQLLARTAGATATDDEQALDLIYAEFLLRRQSGESPSLAEYEWRFPHHGNQLCLLIDLEDRLESDPPPRARPRQRAQHARVATRAVEFRTQHNALRPRLRDARRSRPGWHGHRLQSPPDRTEPHRGREGDSLGEPRRPGPLPHRSRSRGPLATPEHRPDPRGRQSRRRLPVYGARVCRRRQPCPASQRGTAPRPHHCGTRRNPRPGRSLRPPARHPASRLETGEYPHRRGQGPGARGQRPVPNPNLLRRLLPLTPCPLPLWFPRSPTSALPNCSKRGMRARPELGTSSAHHATWPPSKPQGTARTSGHQPTFMHSECCFTSA